MEKNENSIDELLDISALSWNQGKISNFNLFEKNKVRVSVISIPEGQKLIPHSAPDDVLIIGLEGRAKVFIEDKPFDLGPKMSLVFPAKKVHAVTPITDFKMLLIK